MSIPQTITQLNWDNITEEMNEKGYAIIPKAISDIQCGELISQYHNAALYRKTINMERYRFGMGEYKYYQYPLPAIIQQLRENVYSKISAIANNWMRVLNIDKHFPESLDQLLELCHAQGQNRPTPLILQYGKGGYNTLHQDLYGDIYFPMQLVLFLNDPNEDYQGGEFVLIEQRPGHNQKLWY